MEQTIQVARKRGRPRVSEQISKPKNSASKNIIEANSLGSRVKLCRKQLGMGQAQLAQPEYVTSYISAIERDKIRPSLKALKLLAGRLGKPVEYLLYGGDTVPAGDSAGRALTIKLLKAQLLVEMVELDGGPQTKQQEIAEIINELPFFELTEYERVTHKAIAGWLKEQAGDYEEAEKDYLAARQLAQKTGQTEAQVDLTKRLGYLAFRQGQIEQAVSLYRAALDICRNNRELIPATLWLGVLSRLSHGLLALGHAQEALTCHAEILEWQEKAGNFSKTNEHYRQLAGLYRAKQDLPMAARYEGATLLKLKEVQHRQLKAESQARIGEWLVQKGRANEAEVMLKEALQVAQEGLPLGKTSLALIFGNLARLSLNEDRVEEAYCLAEQALNEGKTSRDRQMQGKAYRIMAEIEDKTGQTDKARANFSRSIECLEEENTSGEQLAEAYRIYSKVLEKWGELELALKYLKKAVLIKV